MTNKDIKNAYIGTTEVKAMYLGSTKVWSKEQVEVTDNVNANTPEDVLQDVLYYKGSQEETVNFLPIFDLSNVTVVQ